MFIEERQMQPPTFRDEMRWLIQTQEEDPPVLPATPSSEQIQAFQMWATGLGTDVGLNMSMETDHEEGDEEKHAYFWEVIKASYFPNYEVPELVACYAWVPTDPFFRFSAAKKSRTGPTS